MRILATGDRGEKNCEVAAMTWIPQPGEQIEFLSSQNGGVWKPGIVVELWKMVGRFKGERCVRIGVSDNVMVIRKLSKCRQKYTKQNGNQK